MATALQWVEIDNFSAGIFSDYSAGVGVAPSSVLGSGQALGNGAATTATFKCCADKSGALVPLPARAVGQTSTVIPGGNTNAANVNYMPATNPATYITDAVVYGSFYRTSASGTAPTGSADKEMVAVLFNAQYDPAAGGSYSGFHLGRLYPAWDASLSTIDFTWYKHLNAYTTGNPYISANTIVMGRDLNGSYLMEHLVFNQMGFHRAGRPTIQFATTPTAIPANELTLTTYDTDASSGGGNYPPYIDSSGTSSASINAWPQFGDRFGYINQAVSAATTGVASTGALTPLFLEAHQGRIVAAVATAFQSQLGGGAGGGGAHTGEQVVDQIFYSAVDNLATGNGTITVFGESNPAAADVLASLTVDQLLIIRRKGGGAVIRGDLDNPTVVMLPFIESTHGAVARPAKTPIGVVYGSTNGIYAWQGGDTSTKLSPQIDGFFWRHETDTTNEKYSGYRGKFAWWDPWVVVPNNYMFDTRSSSWWRLEDTASAIYNVYDTTPDNDKLCAFRYKLTASQNTVWDKYDPAVLSSTYQWTSQPLWQTTEKLASFQTLRVKLSLPPTAGSITHTVAVTLSGFDQNGIAVTPVTTTFTFAPGAYGTSVPIIAQKDLAPNFNAQYVTIKIVPTASSGPAAKVHGISLGVGADRARTPVAV